MDEAVSGCVSVEKRPGDQSNTFSCCWINNDGGGSVGLDYCCTFLHSSSILCTAELLHNHIQCSYIRISHCLTLFSANM